MVHAVHKILTILINVAYRILGPFLGTVWPVWTICRSRFIERTKFKIKIHLIFFKKRRLITSYFNLGHLMRLYVTMATYRPHHHQSPQQHNPLPTSPSNLGSGGFRRRLCLRDPPPPPALRAASRGAPTTSIVGGWGHPTRLAASPTTRPCASISFTIFGS
jgi:hypothetical protein